jgi:D-cysteine desulfhydrase family pyridoxal phosphate-dependent enzyme
MNNNLSPTLADAIQRFDRVELIPWTTPLEHLPRLSDALGIRLWIKRDDLTGIAFGGNKVRKLEFYFGRARETGADTVLITGAIQSNYVRVASACAARLGMECHIQLEERVPNVDMIYRNSGNVLLDQLLGATIHLFPVGEDEKAADHQLNEIAVELSARGRRPFVIPLGADHPPLGSLGYMRCAAELLEQTSTFDHVVLASGSGQTHAGLLVGLRTLGWRGSVIGICVRRPAGPQKARIARQCEKAAGLLEIPNPVGMPDIELHDVVLQPGYGIMNDVTADAIRACARLEGLLVEPVYTGRAMAGLFECVRQGRFRRNEKVIFLHTGGLPALFAYEKDLRSNVLNEKALRLPTVRKPG